MVPRVECEIDGKSRNSFANKKVSVEFKRGRFGARKQESIERKIECSILGRSRFGKVGNDKRDGGRRKIPWRAIRNT